MLRLFRCGRCMVVLCANKYALHDHQPARPVCPCAVFQNFKERKKPRLSGLNCAPFAVYDTATAFAASQTKGQQKTRL